MQDYKKHIEQINTSLYQKRLREAIETAYPSHRQIDLVQMLEVCTSRSRVLWNMQIAPDLDIPLQREFERNLPKIKMRGGISIPSIFLFGYAFGLACHRLSGVDGNREVEVASTSGLYMFLLGLFDHLLDEYPEYFADMGKAFSKETISQFIRDKDYHALVKYADNPLAEGMAQLYEVYFKRSHRLSENGEKAIYQTWCEELQRMHRVEAESVDRRMHIVEPQQQVVEAAIEPSLSAFRVLAISACLERSQFDNPVIEKFAKDYATLTWLVDDVSDLQEDLQEGIWSGLLVKLALAGLDAEKTELVLDEVMSEAVELVASLCELLKDEKWELEDEFSLADILWYVIWSWCGGMIAPSKSAEVA